MNPNSWLQLILYVGVLFLLVKPLGACMAKVCQGQRVALDRVLGCVERFLQHISGMDLRAEMTSKTYALAMLLFNIMGLAVVYALQRLQSVLPLNPQGLSAVTPDSSWNTAVGTAQLLRDNLLTHGLGGLVVPFIGIKLIDMLLVAFGLA